MGYYSRRSVGPHLSLSSFVAWMFAMVKFIKVLTTRHFNAPKFWNLPVAIGFVPDCGYDGP